MSHQDPPSGERGVALATATSVAREKAQGHAATNMANVAENARAGSMTHQIAPITQAGTRTQPKKRPAIHRHRG